MIRIVSAASLIALISFAFAKANQDKIPSRFGVEAELEKYPQDSPKTALRSVVKAVDAKRFDYVLAHLAEPTGVDQLVKDNKGNFQKVVQDVKNKFENDPEAIRILRKFLSDGEFPEATGDTIEVKCPEIKGKQLFMKRTVITLDNKKADRWFLENRTNAEKDKK